MTLPVRTSLTLFLALSLSPLRALAADRDARLAEARGLFQSASAGDASRAPRANALFQALAAEEPENPVILAYAGASAALLGRDATSPLEAVKWTEGGLDQIDLALRKLGPEHDAPRPGAMPARLETLLVAASTFLQVPDAVFHRGQDGRAALSAALSHPAYGRLPPPVQARFQWLSALVDRTDRNADGERAALEKVLSLDSSGALAPQARARLAELSR